MRTGIMLTTHCKGARFWHPCADAESGMREMAASHAEANTYGRHWDHPDTMIEFGTDDGKQFTASQLIRGPVAANVADGVIVSRDVAPEPAAEAKE